MAQPNLDFMGKQCVTIKHISTPHLNNKKQKKNWNPIQLSITFKSSARDADELQMQPAERHVLPGHGHLCGVQQWTTTYTGRQLYIQLCQAIGNGKSLC